MPTPIIIFEIVLIAICLFTICYTLYPYRPWSKKNNMRIVHKKFQS
jgi:cbb3-type cytochrome oxidase subunit 3